MAEKVQIAFALIADLYAAAFLVHSVMGLF